MIITFLGTGTSHGVPPIDCMLNNYESCPQGVCRESLIDSRHQRTRCSLYVQLGEYSLVIDVGPDFRIQCLRECITSIDAVLITHSHADHIVGIPDIRSYTRKNPITFYGSQESIYKIKESFSYIFDPSTPIGGGIPRITTKVIDSKFQLFGYTIEPIVINHLKLEGCFGYRIGPVTYIPDMKSITPEELEKCTGTEVLILNCLRRAPEHVSHLTLPQSIALARKIAPRQCYFIHMSHDIHYINDRAELEPWMDFAWDGLKIEIN